MKLLVINGPNLNLLGLREPAIYGHEALADLEALLSAYCAPRDITLSFFQSNHEGALVDAIQAARGAQDGIIINPAAYTHTSIAILDALKAVALPAVEVHLSDPALRESFRHVSYAGLACIATVKGKGFQGYLEAVDILKKHILGAS
ncbi:MAG: type II 3-dehydroquinate dehydratase [Christensenellales bacterium]